MGLRIEVQAAGMDDKTLRAVGSFPSSLRICTLFPGAMRKAETQETLLSLRCTTSQTLLAVPLPSSGSSGALQVHLVAISLSPSNIFLNNGTT